MKKLSAFLIAGMFAASAPAQNGFYLAPSVGAGIGSQTGSFSVLDANGDYTSKHKSSVLSYSAQIGIGYRYKNWRFQSGIQYISHGYQMKGLLFSTGFDPANPSVVTPGVYKVRFNQIGIPLQAGYAIPLGPRLTLVPGIGVMGAYLLSAQSALQHNGSSSPTDWDSGWLKKYGRFTLWGQVNAQLEYKLSNKISLFGGPSVQYEFAHLDNSARNNQHAFNLHFNAGVRINLK